MTVSPLWIVLSGMAVMALIMVLQSRREASARAALHTAYAALARRRGLSFELTGPRRPHLAHIRFRDSERGLSLTIRPGRARKKSSRVRHGSTVLHLQEPTFGGGLVVYAEQMHPELAGAVATFSGLFDNDLSRRLMGKMLGDDIGANLGDLQAFAPPTDLKLSVLASVDPHARFDPAAIDRMIRNGPQSERGEACTLVIIGESGMELRVTFALSTSEEIERFLDQALALQAELLA